jgi:hypothetical protein
MDYIYYSQSFEMSIKFQSYRKQVIYFNRYINLFLLFFAISQIYQIVKYPLLKIKNLQYKLFRHHFIYAHILSILGLLKF